MKKFKLVFKDIEINTNFPLIELIYENNIKGCALNAKLGSYFFIYHKIKEIQEFIKYINNIILVKDNDDGIRPAGKPDECFYCGSKIGENHQIDCVILQRKNKYSVMAKGGKVGTLVWSDPISSDKDNCEFHKNGSSWCASNSLDDIIWLNNKKARSIKEEIENLDDELRCACGLLEFKFKESENWLGKDHRFYFVGVSDEA